jgi:gas vesicle protein
MSDNRDGNGATVALAFIVGGVVGAGLALLLAPASGRETREKLGRAAEGLGNDLRERAAGVRDEAGARLGHLRDEAAARVAGVSEGARGAFDDARTRSQAAITAAKEAWDKGGTNRS